MVSRGRQPIHHGFTIVSALIQADMSHGQIILNMGVPRHILQGGIFCWRIAPPCIPPFYFCFLSLVFLQFAYWDILHVHPAALCIVWTMLFPLCLCIHWLLFSLFMYSEWLFFCFVICLSAQRPLPLRSLFHRFLFGWILKVSSRLNFMLCCDTINQQALHTVRFVDMYADVSLARCFCQLLVQWMFAAYIWSLLIKKAVRSKKYLLHKHRWRGLRSLKII